MSADFDLEAYLQRIGYAGPRDASFETLASLHARHPAAIPFENLDPLLRRPIHLEIEALQRKLVLGGRGGYCYEHNLLFAEALRALGFTVKGLAARVLWNAPAGAVRPRTHMLLQVILDGRSLLADVGFGGLTLTGPLRLEPGIVQQTPHEPFRIVEGNDGLILEACIRDEWRPLYSFTLEEQFFPDYQMANWFTSTHPASHFLSSLIAARVVDRSRFALLNNQLAVHHADGTTERRTLSDGASIAATLRDTFGVALPDVAGLESLLDRLVPASPAPPA